MRSLRLVLNAIKKSDDSGVRAIKKHVNRENVNNHIVINVPDFFGKETIQLTLLIQACENFRLNSVKALLELGADPNQPGFSSDRGIHLYPAIAGGGYQEILKLLVKFGADLNKRPSDDISIWHRFFVTKEIIELVQPKSLDDIFYVFSTHDLKIKPEYFSGHPLISDIIKFNKIPASRISDFEENSLSSSHDSFFKHTSLTAALKERYGISSPRLTNLANKFLFLKNKTYLTLDGRFLDLADFAKKIYLDRETPNYSDFLDFLERSEPENFINYNEQSRDAIPKFLLSFSDAQIKKWIFSKKLITKYPASIKNTKYSKQTSQLYDAAEMFSNHPEKFLECFKTKSPGEIDTLKKVHDLLNEESENFDQEDFNLNQEKHFKNLELVKNLNLTPEYGIKVAETNHELVNWGTAMGHCVGNAGYAQEAVRGHCIIVAITYKNKPKYCVEISDKSIIQVQGKSNSKPPKIVMDQFKKEFKQVGLLD